MSVSEQPDPPLASTLFGVLWRPRTTFAGLRGFPSARPGASAIAILGMVWGALSLLLWSAGHPAKRVLLPIDPATWYLIQGVLMLPLLTALWWLHSEIAHRLCRRAGGGGAEAEVRLALGFAYAAPMTLHVVAELVAFMGWGMSGLRAVAVVTMPAAALGAWILSGIALHELHRVRGAVAAGAAFAGLLVQAAVGALVLR